ncbi:hypothetical protein ACFJIX_22050 [Roseateles sp. UC29_93]|uniref:hypothetical protein n=1 Tax=Roseateles sp. UC29_93 TaxID=3350177 RepID=UPI00366DD2E5
MPATPDRPDPRRIPDVPDHGGEPASIEELTLRIEMAELRVVRRDLEFRLHWDSLQHRGKAVMTPGRWLLPALGTGASWIFWRLVRGKRRRHDRQRADDPRAHAFQAPREARGAHAESGAERPELGTLQLLTVLWGLVPTRLRGQVGPEVAQLLMGVLAGFLQGRKKQREETREQTRAETREAAR